MNRVKLTYASVLSEITKAASEPVELDEGATMDELIDILGSRYGDRFKNAVYTVASSGSRRYFATLVVNGVTVNGGYVLKDGDSVTFLISLMGG